MTRKDVVRGLGSLVLAVAVVGSAAAPGAAQAKGRVAAQDTTLAGVSDSVRAFVGDSTLRPVPAPVVPPLFFRNAMNRDSRSADGRPGPSYWTQWSHYDISAKLDPKTALLTGTETIRYRNRSPYTLRTLVVHLYQNLYSQGVIRGEPEEITGGMKLSSVVVGRDTLSAGDPSVGPSYGIDGTVMTIRPGRELPPGDSISLRFAWSETLPQHGSGRMGWSDHQVYMVAYWFPKMAVFDDLQGWDDQHYMGTGEFYEDYGDYSVSLTVPAGWTLWATGKLENPPDVYTKTTIDRLQAALAADTDVVVASTDEVESGKATAPAPSGWLTYRFKADSVRDFAWTTSDVQRWDATSAVVHDSAGAKERRVLINSFWREDRAPLWEDQWKDGKEAIEFHSKYTGLAYPWPSMTSVEGADIIGGGMEFPMMTLIGPYKGRGPQDLFSVTTHELAHMWVPMIVGTNETRYAWMDEGSTTFLEDQSEMQYWPGVDHHLVEMQDYLRAAAADQEQSMMRSGNWYAPGPGYEVASYSKPATLMVALRELLGTEVWEKGYRSFISDWKYKHPTPWDFFNTFERVSGTDLDWFWTSFYYETWALDQAVLSVTPGIDGGGTVKIVSKGMAPYPTRVHITTSSGEVDKEIPVSYWLEGHVDAEIDLPASVGTITRVQLNPEGYAPDVDRTNDFWPRGG
jgi:Peptidase family M1 domain